MSTVAIVGGSLTGNRGAASMVHGVIDGLGAAGVDADVVVFTPLADDDAAVAGSRALVPFGPVDIVRSAGEAAGHRASSRLPMGPATRAIAAADVVVDVSGISFVDSRGGATLAYNVLLLAPALLLGVPVVKAAQAMGPFERPANRAAAQVVLPRVATVLTRGAATDDMVRELGVPATRADDVAFLMEVDDPDRAWARAAVGTDEGFVVVSPSAVVVAQDEDGSYERAIGRVVADLAAERPVLLVPHSSRPGRPESRLNDLPLCERLAAAASGTKHPVRVVGADASPQQLRALIEQAELCVTSRFHAMISALAVATPVVVVSWSHKYREVLDEFGLGDVAIDFRAVTVDALVEQVRTGLRDAPRVRDQIRAGLPAVQDRARRNITSVRAILEAQ